MSLRVYNLFQYVHVRQIHGVPYHTTTYKVHLHVPESCMLHVVCWYVNSDYKQDHIKGL